MKRALLLAALLAGPTAAFAQADPTGFTQNVNQTSPSILQFTGTGTSQFNSSKGTNNQFNVGSSTNLGVNASISATEGVTPSATANLEIGRGSQLQQTIGSSSNAANAIAVQASATNSAFQAANSSEWGASYEDYHSRGGTANEAAWKAGWESKYEQAYSAASSRTNSTAVTNTSDGTISGKFTTTETAATGSTSQASNWGVTAESEATAKYGVSYNPNNSFGFSSESEWKAAYSAAYNSAFNQAKANSGWKTESTVEVKGLGSISNVNASEKSAFTVDLVGDAKAPGGTATGNGSAGASLSSASYATQNSASTASGFIQAFRGD